MKMATKYANANAPGRITSGRSMRLKSIAVFIVFCLLKWRAPQHARHPPGVLNVYNEFGLSLYDALVCHREVGIFSDYDAVKQPDVEETQALPQLLGQAPVFRTGLCVAARVVVQEEHAGCEAVNGVLGYYARVNDGAAHAALRYFRISDGVAR